MSPRIRFALPLLILGGCVETGEGYNEEGGKEVDTSGPPDVTSDPTDVTTGPTDVDPCPVAIVDPARLDFTGLVLGAPATATVTLLNNCAGSTTALTFQASVDDIVFTVDPTLSSINPSEVATLTITATIADYALVVGSLALLTNDPANPLFTLPLTAIAAPDQDGDGSESVEAGGNDCDDADVAVAPSVPEVWYDGIDQDCDGNDYDQDGDTFGLEVDCDDTDPGVYPGAPEVWYDGIDADCRGGDEFDQDGDGYERDADCDDTSASAHPDATEHCADGRDDDCDGEIDESCSGCSTTVPGTSPTVQDGILAAAEGDVVCVAAGTYLENIDFGGRNVTVLGVEGAELTILDGSAGRSTNLPVVTFQTGETVAAVLEGFTIQGGDTNGHGGGVRILDASPTLRDLVITDNHAPDYYEEGGGGGIYAAGGAPTLTSVRVEDNDAAASSCGYSYGLGGGIMLDDAPAVLENVTVIGNYAGNGGGVYLRDSDAILRHVWVSANDAQSGGNGIVVDGGAPSFDYLLVDKNYDGSVWGSPGGSGIWVLAGTPSFTHLVVRDNTTDGTGGALWVSGGEVTLSDSILAGNDAAVDADEVYVTGDGSVIA